jgi:hypothetical protein
MRRLPVAATLLAVLLALALPANAQEPPRSANAKKELEDLVRADLHGRGT